MVTRGFVRYAHARKLANLMATVSNTKTWENVFRKRQMLFEQATGNDKPKICKYFNSIMKFVFASQLWQHCKVLLHVVV